MKKLFLTLAVAATVFSVTAAAPKGWLTDYDKALKLAEKERKHIYVLFTGSDWCHWCIKLRKDLLETPEFRKFAKEKLILVYCDFPRNNQPSPKQLAKQQQWLRQLEPGRGVPAAAVTDSKGKVISRISGYMPKEAYLQKLRSVIK